MVSLDHNTTQKNIRRELRGWRGTGSLNPRPKLHMGKRSEACLNPLKGKMLL
jgi:hypothetical protein